MHIKWFANFSLEIRSTLPCWRFGVHCQAVYSESSLSMSRPQPRPTICGTYTRGRVVELTSPSGNFERT